MDEVVRVGDRVRAQVEGNRAVIGWVIGESYRGRCWVLNTLNGEEEYAKGHCVKISRDEMTSATRGLRVKPPTDLPPEFDI